MPHRVELEPEDGAAERAGEGPQPDELDPTVERPPQSISAAAGPPSWPLSDLSSVAGSGHSPLLSNRLLSAQASHGNAYVQRLLGGSRAAAAPASAGHATTEPGSLARQPEEDDEIAAFEPAGITPTTGAVDSGGVMAPPAGATDPAGVMAPPAGATDPGGVMAPPGGAADPVGVMAPPGGAEQAPQPGEAEEEGAIGGAADQASETAASAQDVATEVVGEVLQKAQGALLGVVEQARALLEERDADDEELERLEEVEREAQTFISLTLALLLPAFDLWSIQARFSDIKIMGPVAIGPPGCLSGPPLLLVPTPAPGPHLGKFAAPLSAAIMGAVREGFASWVEGVMVPGLPWYPAFASWPGPTAPPMPNVPSPLMALPSTGLAAMTPGVLISAMQDGYGGPKDPDGLEQAILSAVGTAIGIGFMTWLGRKQVMSVLGTGPVPTFAPPVVPVGPVVMGTTITPGLII